MEGESCVIRDHTVMRYLQASIVSENVVIENFAILMHICIFPYTPPLDTDCNGKMPGV